MMALRIVASLLVDGVQSRGAGDFSRRIDRRLARYERDVNRELRRRMARARAAMRPVVRRIYQQELRRAAPSKTGALRRSARVLSRNAGADLVTARVRMKGYGFIIDRATWSKHRGWARAARTRALSRIHAEAVGVLRAAFPRNGRR